MAANFLDAYLNGGLGMSAMPKLPTIPTFGAKKSTIDLTPEQEESLVQKIGRKGMGMLGWTAESLGKPLAAVEGIASGLMDLASGAENPEWGGGILNLIPYSDTIGLTDPDKRATGRGLLEKAGVLEKNEEGLDPGDIAGFVADVALDPLSYLTFGGSALGKAGQALKKANLLDRYLEPAAKAAGIGTREYKATKKVADLLDFAEQHASKVMTDATASGNVRKAFEDSLHGVLGRPAGTLTPAELAELTKQEIGGLVGVGLPFKSPEVVFGHAGGEGSAARRMDKIAESIRYSGPGRLFAQAFSAANQGRSARHMQQGGKEATQFISELSPQLDMKLIDLADNMRNAPELANLPQKDLWMIGEGIKAPSNPTEQWFVDQMKTLNNEIRDHRLRAGHNLQDLDDNYIQNYMTRYLGSDTLPDATPELERRSHLLKQFREGTGGLIEFFKDDALKSIADWDKPAMRTAILANVQHPDLQSDMLRRVKDLGGSEVAKNKLMQDYIKAVYGERVFNKATGLPATSGELAFAPRAQGQVYRLDLANNANFEYRPGLIDSYMHDTDKNGNFKYLAYAKVDDSGNPITNVADMPFIGPVEKPKRWIKQEPYVLDANGNRVKDANGDYVTGPPRGNIYQPHTIQAKEVDPRTNKLVDVELRPVVVDRHQLLADEVLSKPEYLRTGIFSNHPIVDAANYKELAMARTLKTETMVRALGKHLPDEPHLPSKGTQILPDKAKFEEAKNALTTYSMGSRKGAEKVTDETAAEYLRRTYPDLETANPKLFAQKVEDIVDDAKASAPFDWTGEVQGNRLHEVLQSQGLNPTEAAKRIIRERMNNGLIDASTIPTDDAAKEAWWIGNTKKVLDEYVKPEYINDFTKWGDAVKLPEPVEIARKGLQSLTSVFKAGVLTWPARYVRDFMASTERLWEKQMLTMEDMSGAIKLMNGQTVEGIEKLPAVQQFLEQLGHANPANATSKEASRALRVAFSAHNNPSYRVDTDITGAERLVGGIDEMLKRLVGTTEKQGLGINDTFKEMIDASMGKKGGSTWKFWRNRGWREGLTGDVLREPEFGVSKAGDIAAEYGDVVPRMAGFLNQIRKGADPAQASSMIKGMLGNYDPKTYTGFEKLIKDFLPFYSFSRGSGSHFVRELLESPGGRMGQVIKASASARNPDETTPDYIANTLAVPLGTAEDGTKRYLTGAGLMHEDPLAWMSLLAFRPQQTGDEAISRLNPFFKGPLEYLSNRAFFQSGPYGPRALDDADPVLARLGANVSDYFTGEKTQRVGPAAGSPLLEAMASNSPASRLLTTLRTFTDARKWHDPYSLPFNLATGVRVTDVSPAAQEGQQREMMSALMKSLGASEFTRVRFTKEQLAKMPPAQRRQAEEWNDYQSLLAQRAKERKLNTNPLMARASQLFA